MGNSPTRSINYTPKMTGWEALELLPIAVKCAVWDGVVSYDVYAIYRHYKKLLREGYGEHNAIKYTIDYIQQGDRTMAAKPWFKRGRQKAEPSPSVICKVVPLRSHGKLMWY